MTNGNVNNSYLRGSGKYHLLRIIEFIRRNPHVTINRIAESVDIPTPTVYRMIRMLDSNQLVTKTQQNESDAGRKAWLYSINGSAGHMLGIGFAKATVSVMLSDLNGNLISEINKSIRPGSAREKILSIIESQIKSLLMDHFGTAVPVGHVTLIAIMVAGDINLNSGVIENYPEHPEFNGFPITDYYALKYGIPSHITKYPFVAAYSFMELIQTKGIKDYVTLVLSNGIGAAYVMDGKLNPGSHGRLGEISSVLTPNGKSLESLYDCSVLKQEIDEYLQSISKKEADELNQRIPFDSFDVESNDFLEFSSALDSFIREHPNHALIAILDKYIRGWSLMAYYLYITLDPETVVLCGFINSSTPTILEMVQKHFENLIPNKGAVIAAPVFDSKHWFKGLTLYYQDKLYDEIYKQEFQTSIDSAIGINTEDYNHDQIRGILANHAAAMTTQEKKELIETLL